MKLNQAISTFRRICPNQFADEELIAWISELDGQAMVEVFSARENAPENWKPYTMMDMESDLLIPFPYDKIYLDWLKSKVDYWNDESMSYSDSYSAFNNAYLAFGDYWRRSNARKTKITVKTWGEE